jgi:tetratricopeptide (TPR) repeat protein
MFRELPGLRGPAPVGVIVRRPAFRSVHATVAISRRALARRESPADTSLQDEQSRPMRAAYRCAKWPRAGALAAFLFVILSMAPACRTARSTHAGEVRVLRAGQHWESKGLELTAAEERMIDAHAHFAAGVVRELEDATEAALVHYQAALEKDPENEELTLDVIRKLVELRRLEDARRLLERATRSPDTSGMLWGLLGTIYSLQGNPDDATAAHQEAIRRMPGNIQSYQNLAQIYLEAGQATNALAVLEKAAHVPEADTTFLIVLANTLGVLQQTRDPAVGNLRPRIIALLDRAAAQEPEEPEEILRLADLYQLFGEGTKSIPLYERLLASDPDLPGLRERLAQIYLQQDNRDKAVEQLRALAVNQPGNPLPHYFLGVLALEAKQFQDASDAFNRVLVLRPDNQAIYFELAVAHLSNQKPEEALSILKRARDRFRPSFQLEFYSALASMDLERYEDAIRHFTAAEVIAGATAPDYLTPVFYFQSGVAHERAKRLDDAAVQFLKAIELKPDFADALNYLGYMWAEVGTNLERAHELIQKAVEIEPDNAAFLDSLAWVLHQMGRSEEALPHQVRAVELTKEPDATLLEHLGDIYQRIGKIDEARKAWQRALEVVPKPEVEKKLRETAAE